MGVQRTHALNAIKKIEPCYANILKGHVALYDMARLLCADEQAWASAEEVQNAVQELQGRDDIVWPVDVLQALHERRAGQLQTQVKAEMQETVFKEFLNHMRPYPLEIDDGEVQLPWPKLSTIRLRESVKLQLYSKALVEGIIVPLIMEGEPSCKKMLELMKMLETTLQQHLMEDLDDDVVRLCSDLVDCATTVRAVMTTDAFAMLPAVESVDKIRKHFRVPNQKPLAMIANALAESTFWVDKITTFIQLTCTVKVHKQRIDELQTFVQSEYNLTSRGPMSSCWRC